MNTLTLLLLWDKAMQVAKLMAIANTDGVNVRSEPNTESRIWTQIASSEKFLVVSQQDGWVEMLFLRRFGLGEGPPVRPVLQNLRF